MPCGWQAFQGADGTVVDMTVTLGKPNERRARLGPVNEAKGSPQCGIDSPPLLPRRRQIDPGVLLSVLTVANLLGMTA